LGAEERKHIRIELFAFEKGALEMWDLGYGPIDGSLSV
jgi:hypothetical protein